MKMGKIRRWAWAALLLFSLALGVSRASAFTVPERLVFDLKWLGIKAGTAVLEVREGSGGGLMIVSTAESDPWVSVFYTVRDRVESVLSDRADPEAPEDGGAGGEGAALPASSGDPGPAETPSPEGSLGVYGLLPVNYHIMTREGRHRKDKEITFDRARGKALYMDHLNGERKEAEVPYGVHDPLSSFYLVRTMDLQVGKSVYVPVFDSKRLWSVEVQVLRKERVEVKAGAFDAIVIKPLMKSEGIFSRKGDIYIWLTDDERRMPVLLRSEVAVGSIDAELVKAGW
ncbi:MAG: DUF3108 domain-containing protein [Thermodesulfovibrionales bacterium]